MILKLFAVALVAACGSDLRTQTHAFVAPTPCGQGPYEVHFVADGRTGEEGVEIVACTAHRLAGHVEVVANHLTLYQQTFGDVADNQRCLAGGPIVATRDASASSTSSSAAAPAGPAAAATNPTLVEQPYHGSETPFADELCKPLGLAAQVILIPTTTTTRLLRPGTDLHVRIWSDVPNDLERAVFMIRHVTSTKTLAEVEREDAKRAREAPPTPAPARSAPHEAPPDHGPPPAPLAEARPAAPSARATWIAGSWTWTGSAWGWTAGFWRDERLAMPAPRVEVPGAPPGAAAVWLGGTWRLEAGGWIWIRGRWR